MDFGKYIPEKELPVFMAWLVTRRPRIQAMIKRYPPTCYRLLDRPGHYWLHAWLEDGTVMLIEGRDSKWPGVAVFDIPAENLERCDCGDWQEPTARQRARVRERIAAL